ncbi:hypothetical protein AB0M47_02200 [Hamadaea sp. NPDC051192]|uniref:hypothetical protein n=1 Tax=Hamadaea sp. NPDC051192 TaxID=3154940 RepID=UPI00341EB480
MKVTDATDAPSKLKVTLTWLGEDGGTGVLAMSYSKTSGLFEASVPGVPVIPHGYVTFTVKASDAAGNRATPLAGPKVFSYSTGTCN